MSADDPLASHPGNRRTPTLPAEKVPSGGCDLAYAVQMTTPQQALAEWTRAMTDRVVEAEHSPYRVVDYLGWQRDGSLELRPHYQRGSVWTKRDKSFLIDSVIKGYPLPLVVLQDELHGEHPRVRRRVVDGQQRLRTLLAFIEPDLLDDLNETDDFGYTPPELAKARISVTFDELHPVLQTRVLNTRIPAVLLSSDTADREVLEVYDRLNSTGLGLNAQELRYARRTGAFAEMSYQLARQNQSRWTEWRLFRDQDIARMKEVEFTSELLLMLLNGVDKTGRTEIDSAYRDEQLQSAVPDQDGVEKYFLEFMKLVDDRLARPSKPDGMRMFRTKGWFYALLALSLTELQLLDNELRRTDASLLSASLSDFQPSLDLVIQRAPSALEQARSTDPDLVRSISGAASDRSSRTRRVRFLESLA